MGSEVRTPGGWAWQLGEARPCGERGFPWRGSAAPELAAGLVSQSLTSPFLSRWQLQPQTPGGSPGRSVASKEVASHPETNRDAPSQAQREQGIAKFIQ